MNRISRREMLRKALVFSASLMAPRVLLAGDGSRVTGADMLDLFCFGDWGTRADSNQCAVALALQEYARAEAITPHALMLLGDNFYGPLPGTDSPRWEKEFESMYPARTFPGPCYAVLGNHDYDDQPGGEKIQLAYAKTPGTRWKMPSLWYRLDLPEKNPVATFLCVDTHHAKMSMEEIAAQQAWLEEQLAAPRVTPWMVVCGHHPVLSRGTTHGDSKHLEPWRELFYRNNVHAYLCGHEHDLQHLQEGENPTHWLVSGGGGANLYSVDQGAGAVHYARMAFGFLHLSVGATAMKATFVGTDAKPLYAHSRAWTA